MPIKATGSLSLNTDIVGEFGGVKPHSMSEYYRNGERVPNATISNASVPLSGEISLSNFYGTRKSTTNLFTIGAFSTTSFSAGDGAITYRLLGSFTIPEPKSLSYSTTVTIRGDEREDDSFTSTNLMLVRNPTISIYRGGSTSFNGTTTPPNGVLVESGTSFVENATDNFNTVTTISAGPSSGQSIFTTYYVVASMYCERIGGPDAPTAIWTSPAFNVVGVTA